MTGQLGRWKMLSKRIREMFERSKRQAENLAKDGQATSDLLNKAFSKAESNRKVLGDVQGDFFALLRMLRAFFLGSYRGVPWKTIVSAVAAVVYFVNPLDVIPDFFIGTGFLDDLSVFGFVLSMIRSDLDAFRMWEKSDQELTKTDS